MNIVRPLAASAFLLTAASGAAAAQAWSPEPEVTIERAIEIARDNALVVISDVERDGSRWEIDGYLADGTEVELRIIGESGDLRRDDWDRSDETPPAITVERAIEIARANDLRYIEEASFDDGVWEIEGYDDSRVELEIDISGQTGEVLHVDRD